jgi:peroxiredoxin
MTSRRLEVGERVPDFWTRDIRGEVIDSKDFDGSTLLAFLRYAGCPFCNLAILRLSHENAKLNKHGCKTIAFIQSTEANIEKNIIDRHAPSPAFSIVSDHEQDFYKMFGVRPSVSKTLAHSVKHAARWMDASFKKGFKQANVDGNAFMVPAVFLINAERNICYADYDADFYGDTTFNSIYDHLKT